MPFSYYDRLTRQEQAIYDQSDRVTRVHLSQPEGLRPVLDVVRQALERDQRRVVQAACQRLVEGLTGMLGVEAVEVSVLAIRPSLPSADLHGLYTRDTSGRPRIRVWMRTARYRRVVAFKTFVRTVLHEVCHHLDYAYLGLGESFHTEGFFKRESSLFYQLVPRLEAVAGKDTAAPPGGQP